MNTLRQIPQWRVVAASVCGTSHSRNKQLCQDAHHWQILPNRLLAIAAADGAGSASLGQMGAKIAVETAIAHLAIQEISHDILADDLLLSNLLTETTLVARKSVEAQADACHHQPQDLATTLIILLATPQVVAVVQIGDGSAVAQDSTGNLLALTTPSRGEYINETTFLTSPDALDTAQIKLWREKIVNIGVFTDGLQMLAQNLLMGEPHKPFFAPLFEFVSQTEDQLIAKERLVQFLSSERITQRTDDDLTLVIATFTY
jgi:hypothetical protein